MLQVISVAGAFAILAAYAANQMRLIGPSNLTVIAVVEVRWGVYLA